MIPLVLDLRRKTVLLAGDGEGGRRLARELAGKAEVVLLNPTGSPDLADVPHLHVAGDPTGPELAGLLEGTFLVVPATGNPDANDEVARAAREAGCFAHLPHGEPSGDTASTAHVPRTLERGPLLVAVTSRGENPILEEHVLQQLHREVGPEVALMGELLARLRERLNDRGAPEVVAREALGAVLWDKDVWDELRANDLEGALARVEAIEGVTL